MTYVLMLVLVWLWTLVGVAVINITQMTAEAKGLSGDMGWWGRNLLFVAGPFIATIAAIEMLASGEAD